MSNNFLIKSGSSIYTKAKRHDRWSMISGYAGFPRAHVELYVEFGATFLARDLTG